MKRSLLLVHLVPVVFLGWAGYRWAQRPASEAEPESAPIGARTTDASVPVPARSEVEPEVDPPTPVEEDGRPTISEERFRELFDAYLRAAQDLSEPDLGSAWEWVVGKYEEKAERLRQEDPRFEQYPFLDPRLEGVGGPLEHHVLQDVLLSEVESLRQGMFWDESPAFSDDETNRAAALAVLNDSSQLVGLPPSQLASMPWFGDVPHERILEQLPVLQSLRQEYVQDVLPFLVQRAVLRSWWARSREAPEAIPAEFRVDIDAYAEPYLQQLDQAMDVFRLRYLRDVGEALGAEELPPSD